MRALNFLGSWPFVLGHRTLIARQNPSMQPKGRRHACVMEPSQKFVWLLLDSLNFIYSPFLHQRGQDLVEIRKVREPA